MRMATPKSSMEANLEREIERLRAKIAKLIEAGDNMATSLKNVSGHYSLEWSDEQWQSAKRQI